MRKARSAATAAAEMGLDRRAAIAEGLRKRMDCGLKDYRVDMKWKTKEDWKKCGDQRRWVAQCRKGAVRIEHGSRQSLGALVLRAAER